MDIFGQCAIFEADVYVPVPTMSIDIDIFSFPVSALGGAAFLLLIYILHKYAGESAWVRALSGRCAAVISLICLSLLMAIEGVFALGLQHSIFFVVAIPVFLLSIGLSLLKGLRGKACFLLCHGGLFLMIFASYFGAADVQQMKLALREGGEPAHEAYYLDGTLAPLPFSLALSKFEVEYYNGTQLPKQYISTLSIDGQCFKTSVNHPCHHAGFYFFQDGTSGEYSVIGLRRDPWLPLVYLGMIILASGCVLLLAGKWKLTVLLPVAIVVAAVFTVVSIARINFGTLMPALRSLWFVPHLIVYMIAYSLMALALVLAIFSRNKSAALVDRMVRISSSLIAIGMLCGSVWAFHAWGDYWAWDPKECLAAVTWLITVLYIHLSSGKRKALLAVLLAGFIALQFTWYGVNYLPSASKSMHTYNTR